ncbi:MAG TPA: NUDIX domain-containing protein [Bacteroidales bacterium]|nr:NUDIX domain-containing protein [Bacteroidales bacterium]
MNTIDQLYSNYKLHVKSRTRKHASYPERFVVPDDKVKWDIAFPEYAPIAFNAPVVLDPATPWADPQDIAKITHPIFSFEGGIKLAANGLPLNPMGRTGICGRGVVGKWGANFAADGIITTENPSTHQFQVLTITRKDTGEIAFPGGMVDPGEDIFETRNRELMEELSLNMADLADPLYEEIVFKGYADDPRNTDNAWMETTAIHTHITYKKALSLKLEAGDDAAGHQWTDITQDAVDQFYGTHGYVILKALNQLIESNPHLVDTKTIELYQHFFGRC